MKLKQIINLYGGPGIGKSTIASGLFYKMKTEGYNVEYSSEYAKELTYEERFNVLTSDQLYIFAKQHRKIFRMKDQVEYIICDSPLLITLVFFEFMDMWYDKESFFNFVRETNNNYNNINILLRRNPVFDYDSDGRNQTMEESTIIDAKIKDVLEGDYYEIISNDETVDDVLKILRGYIC